jgi:vacuolar-type H+-ATPase subunit F/Vma7
LKLLALAEPEDVRGFRLAGIEAETVSAAGPLDTRLAALASRPDVGLVILSPSAASQVLDAVAARRRASPPFAVVLPGAPVP